MNNTELPLSQCKTLRDKYRYIVNHFDIKKQSDFAIEFEKVFKQPLKQSTIAHNFKRFDIQKSEKSGSYKEIAIDNVIEEVPEDKLYECISKNASRIAYSPRHDKLIIYIKHGCEEELSFLIYDHFQFNYTAIIPAYSSVILLGFKDEIRNCCFDIATKTSGIPIQEIPEKDLRTIKTINVKKRQRKD